MNKFREVDGCFHDDPIINTSDKGLIKILDNNTSIKLWDEFISHNNRHFMLLGDDEWPSTIVRDENMLHFWQDDWNEDKAKGFKDLMSELIKDSTENIVYFFYMREHCIETTWGVFCRNWINFLYEDEGCILTFKDSLDSIVFSNGKSWYGKRSPK